MRTFDCGHSEEEDRPALTAPAGWCAPSEALHGLELPTMCSDCSTRMHMVMTIGIDPGPHGEYLRVKRGGIKYGGQS